ncbi:hypothetical protein BSL82_15615 [Tardibacter chloracetimidivorans]|uniref:Uncharacterized protein n=1 Tax=Tardibacter chloracetimidivorans TaxID=1921510 RepID=A0A1L3ZY31_9SPHN|nr:hypothetical protein [Tardibacter chloracetimidivorans]API60532.1 hypothetical protein BSL82_15615 [Tardibacter chloracetimidivorans]
MAYVVIEDFKAGLDGRKLPASSPQGSLQRLVNAHITRGGEIEKRKAWVMKYSLPPAETFGLAGANGVLYVFGSEASPAVPSGVTYQRLVHPSAEDMTQLTDAEFFDGKVFAAALYANGDGLCFYDGTRVTDWDSGSAVTHIAGQKAAAALTIKSKVYTVSTSLLSFCAVDDPDDWAGTGASFINMSNQSAGSETLTGLGRYQGYLAVFARRNTQIWFLDPDPAQNAQRQVLPNIGTLAHKSIVSFGDIDVFFLSDTGIRSLRARDSSNQAGVSDVGTPIDDEMIEYMRTLTDTEKTRACAIMDPIDGRYILGLGARQYVFSYYSASKISAWSRYDPGFTATEFVSMDSQVWARGGDTIYLYGGDDGETYDLSTVEVELPYIDGRTIATWKQFTGLDVVCEGEWTIYINTNPATPDVWSQVAIVRGTTLAHMDISMVGDSPVIKLKLVNERAGPAKLSKVIIHYQAAQAS